MRKYILLTFIIAFTAIFSYFGFLNSRWVVNVEATSPEWEAGGRVIQDDATETYANLVVTAPDGNLIVKETYYHSGVGFSQYIQKYDKDGAEMWTPGGVNLNMAGGTTDNGLFYNSLGELVWVTVKSGTSGNNETFFNKIDDNGNLAYPNPVQIMDPANFSSQHEARYTPDNNGGFYMTWAENSGGALFAQHFNNAGTKLWPSSVSAQGLIVSTSVSFAAAYNTRALTMPDGTATIVWQTTQVIINRYNSSGAAQLGNPGKIIDVGGAVLVDAIADSEGNIYLLTEIDYDLILHKLDSDGNKLWDTAGVRIGYGDWWRSGEKMRMDDNGNIFVIWENV